MSTGETPRDDAELLERLVTGELAEDSAEARDAFAQRPALRERLAALRAVAATLDAAAADERATLDEAQHIERAPGHDRVEAALRAARAGESGPGAARRPNSRRGLLLALGSLAAAALVVVGRGLFSADEAAPPVHLGGSGVELLTPLGEVAQYGTFRWRSDFPADTTYHLELRDATEGGDADWKHTTRAMSTTEWTPPDDLELPAKVRWEVEARDSVGGYRGHATGSAELR